MNAYIMPGLDRPLTVECICRLVEAHYKLGKGALKINTRLQGIVKPRQIAMFLCANHTKETVTSIGEYFGKHHATVLFAINQAIGLIETRDRDYYNDIIELVKKVELHGKRNHYSAKQSGRLYKAVLPPLEERRHYAESRL